MGTVITLDVNPKIGTDACYREWDDDPENPGWFCVNDQTGCFWNDGCNTCFHEGEGESPLDEEENSIKCPRCGITVPDVPEDASEEERLCNLCYEKLEREDEEQAD